MVSMKNIWASLPIGSKVGIYMLCGCALAFGIMAAEERFDKPSLSDSQRAKWFKAVAQWNATGAPLQKNLQEASNEMKATCEKNPAYTLGDGANGDPECVAKPKPATATAKDGGKK